MPQRPQLSYPIEQRRTIVQGLIGDRENARYTSQTVRYRTGRSRLPPPPPPASVTSAEVEEVVAAPGEPEPPATVASVEEGVFPSDSFRNLDDDDLEVDDGGLNDFIRDMVRDTAPQQPRPAPGQEEEVTADPLPVDPTETADVGGQPASPGSTPATDIPPAVPPTGPEAGQDASATVPVPVFKPFQVFSPPETLPLQPGAADADAAGPDGAPAPVPSLAVAAGEAAGAPAPTTGGTPAP